MGVEEEYDPPVVLWIGVKSGSLAREDGGKTAFRQLAVRRAPFTLDKVNISASRYLDILKEFDITDIEVEIRESEVTNMWSY